MALDYDSRSNNRYLYLFYFLVVTCWALLPMKPATSNELKNEPSWSKPESGIRIGLVVDDILSDGFNLQLCFSNTANTSQRIYFIENSFFRSFQSYFLGRDNSGEIMMLTSPSPPHGYVVGTKDFLLLKPESNLCFDETLPLSSIDANSITHLTWVYQNEIPRWQAGIATFDGETQHLFDDNGHPELWVGELKVEVSLVE